MIRIDKAKFLPLALAAFLIVLAASAASAQPMSKDDILAGLGSRYREMNSLQAAYSRVATTPSTDHLFKSSSSQLATGVLYWARPDKLLLEQSTPSTEIMVTDGTTVWWYLAEEKLVYRYRDIDVASQLRPLMSFLSGIDSLNADFKVSKAPAEAARAGQHGLILLPKEDLSGGVDRLTVWCDNSFALTGFRLHAVTGETTDFRFTGLVENAKIDKKKFSFKPPRGTEIIEEE